MDRVNLGSSMVNATVFETVKEWGPSPPSLPPLIFPHRRNHEVMSADGCGTSSVSGQLCSSFCPCAHVERVNDANAFYSSMALFTLSEKFHI